MTIGEKIYELRKKLGLSQKEFAEKVGTSQSAINYWENGKRQPRIEQLEKIAKALDVSYTQLMDYETVETELDIFELYTAYLKNLGCKIDMHIDSEKQLVYTLEYHERKINLSYTDIHSLSYDTRQYIQFKLEQLLHNEFLQEQAEELLKF